MSEETKIAVRFGSVGRVFGCVSAVILLPSIYGWLWSLSEVSRYEAQWREGVDPPLYSEGSLTAAQELAGWLLPTTSIVVLISALGCLIVGLWTAYQWLLKSVAKDFALPQKNDRTRSLPVAEDK